MKPADEDVVVRLIEDNSPVCEWDEKRVERLERLVDYLWKLVHELPVAGEK